MRQLNSVQSNAAAVNSNALFAGYLGEFPCARNLSINSHNG
jgi:hypothetical protein